MRAKDETLKQKEELLKEQAEALKQKEELLKEQAETVKAKDAEIEKLDGLLQTKNLVITAREERISSLLNSLSWKITKPLREISSVLLKK